MSWPLASHFSAMLQNPQVAFRDPELKQCRVEKDRNNQPRPWSGAFAVVYKGMDADGQNPFALRVFTTESPERRERYDLISAYLKTRRLKCLVDFEFRDDSIRSGGDGKWYPLITMDWVEGETLFQWTRRQCLGGNRQALETAAAGWLELVKELADAGISHGDLQCANVMVTRNDQLKLVDYDCMCVPALVGRRNLEVGVEPYQHPNRNETTHLSPDLDRYSALVIHVALRAVAVDPSLWTKYVEQPEHDKLLFRIEDFRAAGASPLYHDLVNSPAEDVRDLTEKLFATLQVGIDQVPSLAQLTSTFAKVEVLLHRQQWEAAVEMLNRRGQFRDAPEFLKPLIHQAYEFVCRKQAWAAFETLPHATGELNDRKLVNAWNEVLFAGFEPAERERARVTAARENVNTLDRLHHLLQRSSKETTLDDERRIIVAAKHLPRGYEYGLRPRVERARQCFDAVGRLRRALGGSAGEVAITEAWRGVVRAQCERFIEAADRPRIELAEKRFGMVESLGRIADDLPPDQLDRRLLDVWSDDLAEGCAEAEAWRGAYEEALHRKDLLDRIEHAIGRRDDSAVIELVEDPALEGYALPVAWTTAIATARDRIAKTDALLAALDSGDRDSFLTLFDARIFRQFGDRFSRHEALLSEWTRSDVLPLEGMGLRLAVGRASLVSIDQGEDAYRARWTWPQQRFTDECFLAICPDEPDPDVHPRDLDVQHRLPMDRQNWESGGGSRVIHVEREWAGSCVVVWALVDLGFRTFASHPLVLGRLDETKRRSLRRWRGWNVLSPQRGKKASGRAPAEDAVEPRETGDDPP